jgi:hypothetical protein
MRGKNQSRTRYVGLKTSNRVTALNNRFPIAGRSSPLNDVRAIDLREKLELVNNYYGGRELVFATFCT